MRGLRATKRAVLVFSVFAGAWVLLGGTVQAATVQRTTASVTIKAGSLRMSSPTVDTVATVPLDGTAKGTSVPLNNLAVTDATGTGGGWHLAVQATPLASEDAQLSAGALQLACPDLSRDDWVNPGSVQTTKDSCLIDAASAVIVADAAPGEASMGSFASQGPSAILVSVPADTSEGTYHSTVFISLISGP
jgi:hypothetical protein